MIHILFTIYITGVIDLYLKRYLRKPTWSNIQQIVSVHEDVHGFFRMIGSIDCTHLESVNCYVA